MDRREQKWEENRNGLLLNQGILGAIIPKPFDKDSMGVVGVMLAQSRDQKLNSSIMFASRQ